jgi:hypothetical protein
MITKDLRAIDGSLRLAFAIPLVIALLSSGAHAEGPKTISG